MLKPHSFAILTVLLCLGRASAWAQNHGHSDIEFSYGESTIVVTAGPEGFVFEGEFPAEGIDRQFTSEPGFASELAEGFGIQPGDQITYDVLESLVYWNNGFQAVPAETQIRIVNRPPAPAVPDTIVSATSGLQLGDLDPVHNRVGEADGAGNFHSDLAFLLEPDLAPAPAPQELFGAYGVQLRLATDAAQIGASNPFYIVFNFGLDEATFEQGVAAYAALVPEPATATMAWLGCLLIGKARLRR
jgi:hypothetical protein